MIDSVYLCRVRKLKKFHHCHLNEKHYSLYLNQLQPELMDEPCQNSRELKKYIKILSKAFMNSPIEEKAYYLRS